MRHCQLSGMIHVYDCLDGLEEELAPCGSLYPDSSFV
jgi:hypothetical protein